MKWVRLDECQKEIDGGKSTNVPASEDMADMEASVAAAVVPAAPAAPAAPLVAADASTAPDELVAIVMEPDAR